MSIHDDALKNFMSRQAEFDSDQKLYVRFTANQYVAGPDKAPLPLGSRYVVDFLDAGRGYVRFEGNKIAEKRIVALGSTDRAPTREELGHDDRSRWEPSSDGQLKDPWQQTFEIPACEVDSEKRCFVFSGKNKGFEIAWNKFFAAVCRQVGDNPGKKPVMEISTGHFKGKFGTVVRPEFILTEWVASGEGTVDDRDFAEDDLNDDVPF